MKRERWRKPGRISLDEAAHGYSLFRIIPPHDSEYAQRPRPERCLNCGIIDTFEHPIIEDTDDGYRCVHCKQFYPDFTEFVGGRGEATITAVPRVPAKPMRGEDATIQRVSLAPTIWDAIAGVAGSLSGADLRRNPRERENAGGRVHTWHVYGARTGKIKKIGISRYVPDAHITREIWSTVPIEMEHIGVIGGDFGEPTTYKETVVRVTDPSLDPDERTCEYNSDTFRDWVHENLLEGYKRRATIPTLRQAINIAKNFETGHGQLIIETRDERREHHDYQIWIVPDKK